MKEFSIYKIYKGESLHYSVVCKTKKRAMELLDVTTTFMRDYGYANEPKTPGAIANPGKLYAYADSGLIFQHRRDLLRVSLPAEELHSVIDELYAKKYLDKSY